MQFRDLLHALRSGWWLIAAGLVVGVGFASALSWFATPLYSSSTQLFVSVSGSTDTSAAYQGNLFSQQRMTSYAQLLTGVALARDVAEDLNLDLSPTELARKVTARPLPDTVILEVTVTDTSAERAQDIAESLVRQFTGEVADLEADVSQIKVSIVQPASLNRQPVSPRGPRNIALGAILGALIGFGLSLLRDALDNTIKTADDVLAATDTGLIGTVLEDPRLGSAHVITPFDEHSSNAEAFRAIRTNLQFLNVDDPPRVIVVASSVPGEGKSTLVVNLSIVLAQAGSRVLLIEADLRRPRVTRYMGLVGGAGLTNVLAGTADVAEVVQPWGDGKLDVLAAGPTPPNPSEILGTAHMRNLLQTMRETYDFVIIDTPPLLPVTDAAVLSVFADGCVVTTRFGKTQREQLAGAAAALSRVDAKLLGVVLNRVPQALANAGGYGYGYEYRADSLRGAEEARAGSRAPRRRGRKRPSAGSQSTLSPAGGDPG